MKTTRRILLMAATLLLAAITGLATSVPPAMSDSQTVIEYTIQGRLGFNDEAGHYRPLEDQQIQLWMSDANNDQVWRYAYTDMNGYFSGVVPWDTEDHNGRSPNDYHLEFLYKSREVAMLDRLGYEYQDWYNHPRSVTGTDLDLGQIAVGEDYIERGFSLVYSTLRRAHRWLETHLGYDLPRVEVILPHSTGRGGWYAGNNRIHLQRPVFYEQDYSDPEWNDGLLCYIYAWHWMAYQMPWPDLNLCNGICDPDPPSSCAYCDWCQENSTAAWYIGFANWFSRTVTAGLQQDYGDTSYRSYDFEDLQRCSVDDTYHTPEITPAFVAAFLQDISDDNQDQHGVFGAWSDVLAMGHDEIFLLADMGNPSTPEMFFEFFKDSYPAAAQDLWDTGMNCGIDVDTEPPGTVGNLVSSSHVEGASSGDTTVDLAWTRALDDASGVLGYAVDVAATPGMPALVLDVLDVTSYTTEPLVPGASYYINIATQDRSGRWSSGYASFGPVVIASPGSADLEFWQPIGWGDVLVPRPAADAAPISVPLPVTLNGNVNSTYWNISGINTGPGTTTVSFAGRIYIDGEDSGSAQFWSPPIVAGQNFNRLNGGPVLVRGGRHTFEARLDAGEAILEPNEQDNRFAHSWVWTPFELPPDFLAYRSAPPSREGGWNAVTDGSDEYWNCDGLRFTSSGWWNAFIVYPIDNDVNYTSKLFAASTGASDGFEEELAFSFNAAGTLDGFLVNRQTMGVYDWDVGVYNDHVPASSVYKAMHVTSTNLPLGSPVVATFDSGQMLRLYDIDVPAGGPWPISITLQTAPDKPVRALYRNEAFTTGIIANTGTWTATDADGFGRLDIPAAGAGRHGLAVYRHPNQHTDAFTVTIEASESPPDLRPVTPGGWWRPLVPRPLPDGTPTQVALPDTLHGNVASTYLNMAIENQSATDAPALTGDIYLDGVGIWEQAWGSLPGGSISRLNLLNPWLIRGGRHTLAIHLDDDDVIEEIDEDDNNFGHQYCWSPLEVAPGAGVLRAPPPERTGNWGDVLAVDYPLWYNCDGLRLPSGPGWWRAVAVMPGFASDVDLRLHETLSGSKEGFKTPLVHSGWGPGESDFVLVNSHEVPGQEWDAGVVRTGYGLETYTASASVAATIPYDGDTVHGPHELLANQILHIYQLSFVEPGYVTFDLKNLSGTVDWGLSLYPPGEAFLSKSDILDQGAAWGQGPGEDETFSLNIIDPGDYCLAVWKRNRASLTRDGTYQLHIWEQVAGVEDGSVPLHTALIAVYPNPFNPQATIRFDLVSDAPVRLEVFDLQGRLVRTLVDGERVAGRHEEIWDGRDMTGRQVASGVYFYRLKAGEFSETRSMTLVK